MTDGTDRTVGTTAAQEEPLYSGRVIVRLRSDVTVSIREQLKGVTSSEAAREWRRLVAVELGSILDEHRGLTWGPLIRAGQTPLEAAAPPPHLVHGPSLTHGGDRAGGVQRDVFLDGYLVIQGAPEAVVLQALLKAASVETAYREPALREPAPQVAYANDPFVGAQGYLEGRGKGVNARHCAVWGRFDGSGVKFVDIERSWRLDHEDLPTNLQVIHGTIVPGAQDHGTKTLGVIVGCDNDRGIVGLAPNATCAGLASRVLSATNEWDLPNAIAAAVAVLDPGDVLLIEVETFASDGTSPAPTGLPVEVFDHWFSCIRYAVEKGIVVIEPAGNGGFDLDEIESLFEAGARGVKRRLERGGENDSGAILVSGCGSSVVAGHHEHQGGLNRGTRVDCYGWGENVFTTSGAASDTYASYGHTSAAAAVVAGVAVLVQHMAREKCGAALTPLHARALLSSRPLGTPVYMNGHRVGVLPDLARIAAVLTVRGWFPAFWG